MPLRVRVELGARLEWHERLGPDLLVGGSARADLRLRHASVAGDHARLLERRGRVVVVDVGLAARGTVVAGRRINAPVVLDPGDVIELGDVRLAAQIVPGEQLGPSGARVVRGRVDREIDAGHPDAQRFVLEGRAPSPTGRGRPPRSSEPSFRASPGLGAGIGLAPIGSTRLEMVWSRLAGPPTAWRNRVGPTSTQDSAHSTRVVAWTTYSGRAALIEAVPPGVRLRTLLQGHAKGRIEAPLGARALILAHLAQALAHRHRAGVGHGSLTPDFVQLTRDGRAVLLAPGPTELPVDLVEGPAARRYGEDHGVADDRWALSRLATGPLDLGEVPAVMGLLRRWIGLGETPRPEDILDAVRDQCVDPAPTMLARLVRVLGSLDPGPIVEPPRGVGGSD